MTVVFLHIITVRRIYRGSDSVMRGDKMADAKPKKDDKKKGGSKAPPAAPKKK